MKNLTLLSLVAATLLFTACGEKTKEAANDAANKVTEAVKEDTASAVEATKKAAAKATESAKAKAKEMADATAAKAAEVKAAAEAKASQAAEALKQRAAAATATVAVTAPAVYAKCKGCHGADGKTKALGKSAVIAGQSKAALVEALHGYKAGTRNVAGMGMLMKGQVASLSDADIDALADYLSQL